MRAAEIGDELAAARALCDAAARLLRAISDDLAEFEEGRPT